MNIFDYILIGIVSLFALIGFAAGTLSQFLGILVIIISLSLGYLFFEKTGNLLLLPLVLFLSAIASKVVMYVLKRIYFSKQETKPKLSFSSRVLGGLIGLTLVIINIRGVISSF